MKILNWVLGGILIMGLAACSTVGPIPPDQITQNLSSILEVEERAERVRSNAQVLQLYGGMSSEKAARLKSHFDVYYVHYLAASVSLAQGDIRIYKTHASLANKELTAMEMILHEPVQPKEFGRERKEALLPHTL